ncbi:alpha-L-rhamnosidase-related protein [Marinoscillum pacificum]|uniref:alpha-L-rhamnosidase-related protein n=1 Tax=Marinoscillum pacificum TaxID=392723 RepID=UPI002157DC19|nr:GH116 family glycosyl hydrolase [Marinoscillum pacificum]
MKKFPLFFGIGMFLIACSTGPDASTPLSDVLQSTTGITGKREYLNTPYVTAGDRVYSVGLQNGAFADLGWHITDEMGGIWDHPIKLMDGYVLGIQTADNSYCLKEATEFTNFPVGNQHLFDLGNELLVTRSQFIPDGREGMIVEYVVTNKSGHELELSLNFTGMVDLRPTWLADSLDIIDGTDEGNFDDASQTWSVQDANNNWYTAFTTNLPESKSANANSCGYERRGNGKDFTIQSKLEVASGASIPVRYYIAGSYESKIALNQTLEELLENASELLTSKIERYQSIKSTADLTIPDKRVQEMYTWVKYNTDWLMRDVPELGRGLSAGIPDYPWWFGTDNTYALQGLLATGQHEEVKATIDLIFKLSESVNDNGRIMHEASTNGVVFNPGNLNTTPYFINLLWKYYEWTGDKDFLETTYPKVQQGLTWLASQDKDGNGYPDGAGMMEIHGLHSEMIDVVVYSQAAYAAAAKMAEQLDDDANAKIYQEKADQLKEQINSDWWVEESNSFADFRASRAETLKLIDDAIVRSDTIKKPWAVAELQNLKSKIALPKDNRVQGFVVHHNWVVNTPMELGIADPDKAAKALKTGSNYASKYGMYVTGLDRDESTDASSKWKVFSYVGAVMTLPTGVQAIGEARYGNADKSLEYLKMLSNSFSYALPGSMYEVSPDYGMICQAWNIYAIATPIIEHYFGVKPMADDQKVIIEPNFPSGWDNAKLDNIRVGDNVISIEKAGDEINVTQKLNWEIEVRD